MSIITQKYGALEILTAENITAPHCFTTRFGGVSTGALAGMNLAIKPDETDENVKANFEILGDVLGFGIGDLVLTRDPVLCTVFFGIGIGVALGVVIRAGASTGGMDIPPLVLNKLFRVPVSVGLYAFDFCILLAQLFFSPAENVLYGIVMTLLYSAVIDKMLLLGQSRTELKIVSSKSRQISDAILRQVDRGVTLLHGQGGYLGNETELVLTVISNRELIKVEKLIHQIDPECFMVVSRVSEVRGRGFSLNKQYQ